MKKTEASNLMWFIFGGLIIALEYMIASIILIFTVRGITLAKQTMKIGSLNSGPFGKRVYQKRKFGFPSLFIGVVWLFFGGIWIASSHVILGVLFAVTIIGIPFAQKHFRLANIALSPYGAKILND